MLVRAIICPIAVCLGAFLLTSCTEYFQDTPPPQGRQVAHTDPVTGQTTYSYRPVDQPPSQ